MAASGTSPRRQRHVRPTVAVVLLAVGTAVVLASLPTQSARWLSAAAVVALALGWASLWTTRSELRATRRLHAADRAAAAVAYRHLFGVREAEHADVATAMTERLAEAHFAQHELEGLVAQHETGARNAEARLSEAQQRVRRLEEAVALLQGEHALAGLGTWEEQSSQQVAARNRSVRDGDRPDLKRA